MNKKNVRCKKCGSRKLKCKILINYEGNYQHKDLIIDITKPEIINITYTCSCGCIWSSNSLGQCYCGKSIAEYCKKCKPKYRNVRCNNNVNFDNKKDKKTSNLTSMTTQEVVNQNNTGERLL